MSKIFYLGIDLGTSRTSVATSTGKRYTVESCVGYPKDMIAKKRFKKDYLIGEEAVKNRLAVELVWPLADGVISSHSKALEATSLILKDIVSRALDDKKPEDKLHVAIGVPAEASKKSKKAILESVKGFIDKILIVSEPFAVAYALDKFDETIIVDIGAGTADICRIHGTLPEDEDQITLVTAGNFLTSTLKEVILAEYPQVQITDKIVKDIKEKYGYVSNSSDPIIVTLLVQGKPQKFDITEMMREACVQLTNPIGEAVQKLIAESDPEFQEAFRNNIIIAGGGSRLRGIDRAIEKVLVEYGGSSVICVQDAEFCGAEGSLKIIAEFPDSLLDEL